MSPDPSVRRRATYQTSLVRSDYFMARALRRFIGRALQDHVRSGTRVVDIGCGEQPWRRLTEHLGAQYLGADVTQNAAGSVALRCLADAVPLRRKTADLVLCTEVLEHVPDPARTLAEVRRIVRPGGIVVVTTPFLYPLHEAPWDFQRLTVFQIERLARAGGFEVVSLATGGNEVEVWATLWDRCWSDVLPHQLGPLRTVALAPLRASANLVAAALSTLAGAGLPRRAYLANLAILRAMDG